MKKYNDIMFVIKIVNIFAYCVILLCMVLLPILGLVDWGIAIVTIVSCTIELVLTFALCNALDRIERLEKKLNIKDDEKDE